VRPGVPDYKTIETYAGVGTPGLGTDGLPPLQTQFFLPQDVAFGPTGQPYILDWNNHRVRVIRNNVVETVVGTGELGNADEGLASATKLNHPTHVAFDNQGRLVVSAWHNSKVMRVDLTTGMITRVAGTGGRSFGGDNGPALNAILDLPVAVQFDPTGNMYISDQANARIRMVDLAGTITTICGTGNYGYQGDGGPADAAWLSLGASPQDQSAPPVGRIKYYSGSLYIADYGNHCVRRINLTTNIITTVAGTGVGGYSGDGGAATNAQLFYPSDVDFDGFGNMYIAELGNSCVRVVDTIGVIETVVGTPQTFGFGGDGGHPTAALLDRPYGIAFDSAGNLYVIDTHNHRIRVVRI
jgi:sugar lactone lactonase YvrE